MPKRLLFALTFTLSVILFLYWALVAVLIAALIWVIRGERTLSEWHQFLTGGAIDLLAAYYEWVLG